MTTLYRRRHDKFPRAPASRYLPIIYPGSKLQCGIDQVHSFIHKHLYCETKLVKLPARLSDVDLDIPAKIETTLHNLQNFWAAKDETVRTDGMRRRQLRVVERNATQRTQYHYLPSRGNIEGCAMYSDLEVGDPTAEGCGPCDERVRPSPKGSNDALIAVPAESLDTVIGVDNQLPIVEATSHADVHLVSLASNPVPIYSCWPGLQQVIRAGDYAQRRRRRGRQCQVGIPQQQECHHDDKDESDRMKAALQHDKVGLHDQGTRNADEGPVEQSIRCTHPISNSSIAMRGQSSARQVCDCPSVSAPQLSTLLCSPPTNHIKTPARARWDQLEYSDVLKESSIASHRSRLLVGKFMVESREIIADGYGNGKLDFIS